MIFNKTGLTQIILNYKMEKISYKLYFYRGPVKISYKIC